MGLGFVSGQGSAQSSTQIRDSLQTLTGVNRLDASAIKNISVGTGLPAWQLKTTNYTAVAGDRLRVDASLGNVTITLPLAPTATDADIWIQRIDTTANNLAIFPGSTNFKGVSGKEGLFNSGNIGLSDSISYINSTIGWLPQHDRITYRDQPQLSSAVLLRFEGADNSTTFTDSSSNAIAVSRLGTSVISTTQSKFGSSSLFLPGSNSGVSIADTASLEFLDNDFTIEFWQDLTTAGYIMGKGNALNAVGSAISWSYPLGFEIYCNGGSTIRNLSTPPPASGSLKHIAITRQGTSLRYFVDGVLTTTLTMLSTDSINNVASPIQIGTYAGGSSVGYVDEFAIDIGISRYNANFTPPNTPRLN